MKKIIRLSIYLIVVVCIMIIGGKIVLPKNNPSILNPTQHQEYEAFYKLPENTIDVVFLGASHMYFSVSPEDLYHDYGFTSIDLYGAEQKIWQSYYYLEDCYQNQKPKVVVLEMVWAISDEPQSIAYNHQQIDAMRWSSIKIDAIRTAVKNNPEEHFMDYVFPIFPYHDRWNQINRQDITYFFTEAKTPAKGFFTWFGHGTGQFPISAYEQGEKSYQLPEVTIQYLEKIQELCQKNDTKLVFVTAPTCEYWDGAKASAVQQYANQHDIIYWDFNANDALREEVNIDWELESPDGGNHLDYYGAMKYTRCLGSHLTENFELPDKRKDTTYKKWEEDYDSYKQLIEGYLKDNPKYRRDDVVW